MRGRAATSRLVALVLSIGVTTLFARTFHVPADAPSIQAGLDSLAASDTVLVALGTYAEALQAPPIAFVLKGDVVADTGDYPRPVIDPAPLPGSDSLSCLTLPLGSLPVVEDIRFRNGPGMFPRYQYRTGGIPMQCTGATFRRCIFDSLFHGLWLTADTVCSLRVEQCRFLKVYEPVRDYPGDLILEATDCLFSGRGIALLMVHAGCRLLRCRFGQNLDGSMVWNWGPMSIRDCQFGPPLPGDSFQLLPCVEAWHSTGEVAGNLFTGLQLGPGFISFGCDCSKEDSLTIRHNRFVNSTVVTPQGYSGIGAGCLSGQEGFCKIEIDSNVFENNTGNRNTVRSIATATATTGQVIGNVFRHLPLDPNYEPFEPSSVVKLRQHARLDLHGNRFDSTGVALHDARLQDGTFLDLEGNWWSSASGPFNAEHHTEGQGDTIVGDWVDFDPWCIDTACVLDADPPFILHSSSFILSAYPNPFNSTTLLHLEVPEPQIVKVELFNLLGRRMQEVWSGVVADRQEIAFDGNALASGIYFARATNTIWNRPLITTKLVLLK